MMKKQTILAVCLSTIILGSGCSLIPKNVEFFQKKVKKVPTKGETQIQREKQAAKYIWYNIDEAYIAAEKEHSSTNVTKPLNNAKVAAPALYTSLGPPKKEWTGIPIDLAKDLNQATAKLDDKVDDYRVDNKALEGKKIEGTGLLQMSYFTYLFIILAVLWVGKMALNIYAHANPAVGLGLNALRVPGNIAAKAVSEVVEGGEHFLNRVEKEVTDPDTQKRIVALFKSSQMEKQSRDVQQVVDTLTKK
jgi:hypothetical protein